MELKDFVKSLQPLGEVYSIKRYDKGLHNDTYLIKSSKGKYSLRIYNYKKPSQIEFELAVLDKIKNLKIVPKLIKLENGYIGKYGKKYFIIYEYLSGYHMSDFTRKQLEQVGSFIAEFHNTTRYFIWNKWRYQFYNLPNWKIRKFMDISIKMNPGHLELLPYVIKDLKRNQLDKNLPKGPIHVDIKPENVLFHNGRLSGLIDFDNSYIGPYILDLAKSMVWFGTINMTFDVRKALWLYVGYVKKRRLSNLEYDELYKAIKFAFLSHIFVDYYMRAIKATSFDYFEFIINELYASYKTFKMTELEFYSLFGEDK